MASAPDVLAHQRSTTAYDISNDDGARLDGTRVAAHIVAGRM